MAENTQYINTAAPHRSTREKIQYTSPERHGCGFPGHPAKDTTKSTGHFLDKISTVFEDRIIQSRVFLNRQLQTNLVK